MLVIMSLVLVAWIVLPLPLAVAVGRAFHLGGLDPETPSVEGLPAPEPAPRPAVPSL